MVVEATLYRVEVKRLCFEFEKLKFIDYSKPLLSKAIEKGCYTVTEWLIKQNYSFSSIQDSFLKAAEACYLTTTRVLIESSFIEYNTQLSALEKAISQGNKQIVNLLIKNNKELKKEKGLIGDALLEKQPKMARLLLDHQVTIEMSEKQERRKNTLLVLAMECLKKSACIKILPLLLENKVNINSTGRQNETPLIMAAEKGDIEIMKILLTHAGNTIGIKPFIDQTDNGGYTALMHAVCKRSIEGVKLLLEYKADVNKSSVRNGRYKALDVVPMNAEIKELLLAHGAKRAEYPCE